MNSRDSLEARLAALEARNEEQHKEVANKLEVAFELINTLKAFVGLIESIIILIASSVFFKSGAKPPSSPTLVFFKIPFRFWITKKLLLRDSENELEFSGRIINSWISKLFLACTPPFIMFKSGIGNW